MQRRYPYEIINKLRSGENNLLVSKISQEIEHLKEQFDDTDYKTMKNLQYEAMGKDLPYPWKDVYQAAEEIRVQIREKEAELKNLLQLEE